MKRLVLSATLVLASVATAQRGPLRGMPIVPPPVNHPALAAQPLMQPEVPTRPARGGNTKKDPPKPVKMPVRLPKKVDPDTVGAKMSGTALKKAIDRVVKLGWRKSLGEARVRSAATGKPILWVQSLGEISGFACSALQSLRGVSLPNEEVLDLLESEFVLGNRNIEKAEHVGMSNGYKKTQTAVGTTNGAGGRNVQLIVMATDSTVLHVLPGFWHADDLTAELKFALRLHELYRDESRSLANKEAMFAAMHKSFVRRLSDETRGRSRWQNFDAHYERRRAQKEERDTFLRDDDGLPMAARHGLAMKPLCDLIHERMMARAFVPFAEFDMEDFVDYGRPYYDNNRGHDRGKKFTKAIRANKKRERENAKKAADMAKLTPHTR